MYSIQFSIQGTVFSVQCTVTMSLFSSLIVMCYAVLHTKLVHSSLELTDHLSALSLLQLWCPAFWPLEYFEQVWFQSLLTTVSSTSDAVYRGSSSAWTLLHLGIYSPGELSTSESPPAVPLTTRLISLSIYVNCLSLHPPPKCKPMKAHIWSFSYTSLSPGPQNRA